MMVIVQLISKGSTENPGFCYWFVFFNNIAINLTVPDPDVFWYRLNGMDTPENAPKKVIVTLFPYIIHVKPKWNIVYEYLKTKIF